jgi:hypothetical protein
MGNARLFLPLFVLFVAFSDALRYGHIHMAKTGGTSLNGMAAHLFSGVCGHKGYSNTIDDVFTLMSNWTFQQKLQYTNQWSESRVPIETMFKRGFADCKYISLEAEHSIWKSIAKLGPIELHLPCRRPFEHFLSTCNHRGYNLQPTTPLETALTKCDTEVGSRFSVILNNTANMSLKCYSFESQFGDYLGKLAQFLPHRKSSVSYVFRPTNKVNTYKTSYFPDEFVKNMTKKLLNTYDYYRFCDWCLHSNQRV